MPETPQPPAPVLLFPNDGLGHAEPALRHKLLRLYLGLLCEGSYVPAALCFYTEGVRLVVEGSPVLDLLRQLEKRGIPLLSCQTCLNYFGLTDQVRVGAVGGMHDILEVQFRASKVITL